MQAGESVLHAASALGHEDVASLLITQGAPLRVRNAQGRTARDLANIGGFDGIVRMISHALARGTLV